MLHHVTHTQRMHILDGRYEIRVYFGTKRAIQSMVVVAYLRFSWIIDTLWSCRREPDRQACHPKFVRSPTMTMPSD